MMRNLAPLRAALLGGLIALPFALGPAVAQEPIAALGSPASLVALPAASADLLFSGETARHTLVMVAEPEQLVGSTSLFLTMQTAVSVAPEWSNVTVAVNNQELGTARLQAGEPYSMQFPVPAGVLQPGYNAVSFVVDQVHRVDCSIDATYELWTRIDPAQSGFAFQGARAAAADFATILAAARTVDGTTPLRGITTTVTGVTASRLLDIFQTLAIGALLDRPAVDFAPDAGAGPGIDVITGTRSEIAALAPDLSLTLVDGLNIGRRDDGRVVVAILAGTDAEFDRGLTMLRDGLSLARTGTAAGLAALDTMRGPEVPASGKLSFARLNVDSRDFGGRLFDQSVQFRLPSDFYPADYAQAQINLDALYAPGLAAGAALQFKVNDRIVSTLELSGSRVGEAQGRRLPIPLSAFRPGLNRLEIEATLPAQLDAACAPGATAYNGRRLKLAGTSELELPTLGRIGRFPDLAALDLSLIGGDANKALNLVVPSGDPAELGAAATLMARLAFSSGRVIETTLSAAPTLDDKVPVLMVGTLAGLPDDIIASLPIDLKATPVGNGPLAGAAPAAPDAGPLPALPTAEQLSADARAVYSGLRGAFYGLGLTAGVNIDALRADQLSVPQMLGTDLVVAQTVNALASAPVTVVVAPSAEQLTASMPQLIAPTGWSRLEGAAVSLSSTGARLQTVETGTVIYYPSGENSLTNARLVAAGWLSNTSSVYVLLLLVSALLLGGLTHLLLVKTRTRRNR